MENLTIADRMERAARVRATANDLIGGPLLPPLTVAEATREAEIEVLTDERMVIDMEMNARRGHALTESLLRRAATQRMTAQWEAGVRPKSDG